MAFATLDISVRLANETSRTRHERDIADNLAHHDPLTGTLNRRAILGRLDEAIADAHRNEQPLTLHFIDVDHFKSINDTHGHAVGERCLQAIVEAIGRELRSADLMGRYGGEEFVVVLPNIHAGTASLVGDRGRASVEAHPVHIRGKTVRMTASLGIAGITDGRDNADSLLERADAALYRAKFDGRNRLSMHPLMAAAGT